MKKANGNVFVSLSCEAPAEAVCSRAVGTVVCEVVQVLGLPGLPASVWARSPLIRKISFSPGLRFLSSMMGYIAQNLRRHDSFIICFPFPMRLNVLRKLHGMVFFFYASWYSFNFKCLLGIQLPKQFTPSLRDLWRVLSQRFLGRGRAGVKASQGERAQPGPGAARAWGRGP